MRKKKLTNKIAIYLDDIRTPTEIIPDHDWIVIRTYKHFVEYITNYYKENKKLPDHISFDHDLGEEHINYYFEHKGEPIEYSEFQEKTGMHCAKWFTEMCDQNNIDAKNIHLSVHSHNPIGARNIQEWLNFWKMKKYGPEYAHTFLHKFPFKIKQEEKNQEKE